MPNSWDMIKNGDYLAACEAADREFAESSSILTLRNKVFALLALERFPEAADLCKRIIRETDGSTDSDFIFLGVSQLLMGKFDDAVQAWQRATETKYTDAAG